MLKILVHLLVDAGVLLIAAKTMSTVQVKSFGTALWVAVLVGIIGFLIGWLISGILHVLTLGIFALLGISFIIRIIVNAIVIEIVDKLSSGFNTKGFTPSIILAVLIALAGVIVDYILFS